MRRIAMTRRFVTVVLGVSAVAFALTVVLPHSHGPTVSSHLSASCRLCKIHDGLSATPTVLAAVHVPQGVVLRCAPRLAESPREALLVHPHAPRAPPQLS